jgi:hypothetical protein
LKAPNGEEISASQGYDSKDVCKDGVKSIKNNAPRAEIVDTTVIWREKIPPTQKAGLHNKRILAVGILVAVIAVSITLFAYMSLALYCNWVRMRERICTSISLESTVAAIVRSGRYAIK